MLSKMDKREKDLNDDVASLSKKMTVSASLLVSRLIAPANADHSNVGPIVPRKGSCTSAGEPERAV